MILWTIKPEKVFHEIQKLAVQVKNCIYFYELIYITNRCLISDTEEEDNELNRIYDLLSPDAQKDMLCENLERAFDVSPFLTTQGRL